MAAHGDPERREDGGRAFTGFDPQPPLPMSMPAPDFTRLGESCVTRAAMSSAMGGAMGLAMGIALGSFESANPSIDLHGQPPPPARPTMVEVRDTFRRTSIKARSWGRSFAAITALFSGVECAVDRVRGCHDIWSAVGGGAITGAVLAVRSGPQAMVLGAAGFAAFSIVIEKVMPRH